ncbi:MAG: universal stress protein [Acidimicrobiia bacterium]|nr:universal stress protein [Acidimicrobiia bacterium]
MADLPSEILVCVDFSEGSEKVLAAAAKLAGPLGASIHLLHVAAPEPTFFGYDRPGGPRDRDTRAEELLDEHEALRILADAVRETGLEVTPLLIKGPTIDMILGEAEHLDADLVVAGSHGHGAVHRFLVGSTTESLIRRSERPVLIVPVHDDDATGGEGDDAGTTGSDGAA